MHYFKVNHGSNSDENIEYSLNSLGTPGEPSGILKNSYLTSYFK